MPIDPNSSDKLYVMFQNAGPKAALIVPAVLLNLVAIAGVLLNLSVIYVSLKSKKLRGCVNFLLALISLYEILHQIGHLLLLIIVLAGTNFIDILTAARISLPSLFGQNAAIATITLAAVDRLFALIAPILRKRVNKFAYLFVGTLLSALYGIYITSIVYEYADAHPNLPVTGLLSDLFNGPHGTRWFMHNSILNIAAILCYFLIWIRVKTEQGVTQSTNARLLKSLLAVVLVNICGYLLNMALYQLIFMLLCSNCYNNELTGWQLSFVSAILMNISAASNAPILFFTSTDYKEAFECHLPFINRLKGGGSGDQNRVGPAEGTNNNDGTLFTTSNQQQR